MKIRVILNTSRKEEVDKAVALQLAANPGFELDGLNLNPIKEGVVEMDVIFKDKSADLIAEAVAKATVQKDALISQKDALISDLTKVIEEKNAKKEKRD